MRIDEYTQTSDIEKQVDILSRPTKDIDIDTLKQEWDVATHRVMVDQSFLPDKNLMSEEGQVSVKKVNRIAIPMQKNIVNKAVVFGFGNKVGVDSSADNEQEELVESAINYILEANKSSSFDRKLAKEVYRATEGAELWYYKAVEEHNDYGFPCKFELKCLLLTPWDGEKLHPHFDAYGNMVAFARSYFIEDLQGKEVEYLEAFTDSEYKRYINAEGGWSEDGETDDEGEFKPVYLNLGETINKIPVIYAQQDIAEWQDVQSNIERLELLLSRHAEINDYHASPKTFVKGDLISMPQSGEANGVLQGGIDSDIKILSWKDSPESVKLEIENLMGNIQKFTQTPDISFENIKGLNQVSGVMLRMLFMDAHIKVMQKQEIWDEYFLRRYNLLKSFVGRLLNPNLREASRNLRLTPVFTPFMVDDQKELIESLMTANGNKALISHEKSIELSMLSSDVSGELEAIREQDKVDLIDDTFPTGE